ncbi:MAG: transposase [Patescibacteria group bacterium]|nr:transposase [Patescibacteria group bacterium]MBU2508971.1 transposase [Patescibacteria group bacterium]
MARALRIEYPGALYHITARGNEKRDIFLTDQDRLLILDLLSKIIKRDNWLCHAYCLMNNHYHFLIETPDGNLSAGMKSLNSDYAQKFNKEHNRVGHLFQGRFKAFIIEKEFYLLNVARYVVLNPVRASFVNDPKDWQWSSYRATVGLESTPKFLTKDYILRSFSNYYVKAKNRYQNFVTGGLYEPSPFEKIKEGIVLGSDEFINKIQKFSKDKEKIKEIPIKERMVGRKSLEEIFKTADLDKKKRDLAIASARLNGGYSNSEIGRFLNLHNSTISRIVDKKCRIQDTTPL